MKQPAPSLFGAPDPAAVVPAAPASDALRSLAEALPPTLRMGTSSWSFPGWQGLVWGAARPATVLAHHGLHAYSRHPLFRTVGIDRTWYAPVSAEVFASYARQVPDDFRFLVKAPASLTTPPGRDDAPHFLEVAHAVETWVAPAMAGLGDKLGVLLLQCPPFSPHRAGGPQAFAQRLGALLRALPPGPSYAVEVRSRALLTRDYTDALASVGAAHCVNVFPGMPTVTTQGRVAAATGASFGVVRWMLHPAWSYAEAKEAFRPFHRVVAAHDEVRDELATLLASWADDGMPSWVIANNKAEGSAPLSLGRLARALASG